MDIAIIGGGFTGLTAAYDLTKKGHTVTVFEKESFLGGLAYGFTTPRWKWHIEAAYHHLFTNDSAITALIKDLGIEDALILSRPITATLYNDHPYQLDSPSTLFAFPALSFLDKVRTALLLGILKINPFWKPLEKITAETLCIAIGGQRAFESIWKPLLYGKFSQYAPHIAASWLWARIKKRTPSLYYIRGGFHRLVQTLENTIRTQGGALLTDTAVVSATPLKSGVEIIYIKNDHKNTKRFDRVLITIPTPLAAKIAPLPSSYIKTPLTIPHLHAQVLILETDTPILKSTYWLNVTDEKFPFLAVVAHTNFMDKKYYGNNNLTYIGNYLPSGHPNLTMTKAELIKKFIPFIKRLYPSPSYKSRILHSYLFTAPFAQPVHERHYSQKIPSIQTPLSNIYLANMDSIVPWDRGTNYAVELGHNAVACILKEAK